MKTVSDPVLERARQELERAGIPGGVAPKFVRCPHGREPIDCDTCAVLALGRKYFGWAN